MKNKILIISLSVIIVLGIIAGAVIAKNTKEPESKYTIIESTVYNDIGAAAKDGAIKEAAEKDLGVNIAKNCVVLSDTFTANYVPDNAVDEDPKTYWEASPNFYPNEIAVDLKKTSTIKNIRIKLNPSNLWEARTQTFTIMGSDDKNTWKPIKESAEYKFDPETGNAVIIPIDAAKARYVKLIFTANSAATAGQMAEFEIYE